MDDRLQGISSMGEFGEEENNTNSFVVDDDNDEHIYS